MIGKILILLGILAAGYFFVLPQFQHAGSSPATENPIEEINPLPIETPDIDPKGWLEWLWNGVEWIGDWFTKKMGTYVVDNMKKLIPNASDEMIWLIIGIVILLLIWWKSESFANVVRLITMILIAIFAGVFVLMLLGIL